VKSNFTKIAIVFLVTLVLMMTACEGPPGEDGREGDDALQLPPDMSGGTLDVSIGAVGYEMRGVDNFPSITIQMAVKDAFGNYINGLLMPDFFECVDENDKPMGPIVVTQIGTAGSSSSDMDIVIVFDTTGSMGGQISGMKAEAISFVESVSEEGDHRFGVVPFGDTMGATSDGSSRAPLAPTDDVTEFSNYVNTLFATGGGDTPENAIDAIDYARTSLASGSNPEGSYQVQEGFTYRPGAKKVFVLITDVLFQTPESPGNVDFYYADGGPYNSSVYNTLTDEISKLQADGVTVHVVSPDFPEYKQLAASTGGVWLSIGGSFDDLLEMVGVALTNNYVITYLTDDWSLGTTREVRVAVNTSEGFGEATAEYTSPDFMGFSASMFSVVEEPSPFYAPRSNY
jgi:hypothetical protein